MASNNNENKLRATKGTCPRCRRKVYMVKTASNQVYRFDSPGSLNQRSTGVRCAASIVIHLHCTIGRRESVDQAVAIRETRVAAALNSES